MIKIIRGIILLGALITSITANALTLDFIDNNNTLIGSIRLPYSSLDVNGEWLTSAASINDNDVINRNIGLFVRTFDNIGVPTFTGSTFSSVTVTGTVSGTINGTVGDEAAGGRISLAGGYFMYPYVSGSFDFRNSSATVTPLDFLFSSVVGSDKFVISALGIDVAGNFIIRDKPSTVPLPAAAWLFGSALLGFFGLSRRKRLQA